MTPSYLTLAEAAKELSQQLERQVTESQVLAYGMYEEISIFKKIKSGSSYVKSNPIEGEPNELQTVECSPIRLTIDDVISLLYPSTSTTFIDDEISLLYPITSTTFIIANGKTPPEITFVDYRIAKDSIDKIVGIFKNNIIDADYLKAAIESWENKEKPINFNNWLQLPTLKHHEAIMLLNIHHPERPLNTFSSEYRDKLNYELMQAERAQTAGIVPANASPQDWLNWANENNFNVPTQFTAILHKPQIESIQATNDSVDKRKKWEIPGRLEYKCRNYGNEFIATQKKLKKCQPSIIEIAKHIEKRLKVENCTGPRGDYWDWQTIKREALTGITRQKANGK